MCELVEFVYMLSRYGNSWSRFADAVGKQFRPLIRILRDVAGLCDHLCRTDVETYSSAKRWGFVFLLDFNPVGYKAFEVFCP